jgi:DNA-binding response OmpR family regulator
MVFRASNYDVVLTANGKDALERLKAISPDIIVSDLMMPEMDGSELLTRLKADAQYSNIPVLILTVVSDSDREYSLLDLGADDYCEKTVQRKILLKRVQNLIKRAQR